MQRKIFQHTSEFIESGKHLAKLLLTGRKTHNFLLSNFRRCQLLLEGKEMLRNFAGLYAF